MLSREQKVWIKQVIGVDRSKIGAYAFLGNFLDVKNFLTENTICTGALYMFFGEYNTASEGVVQYACLSYYDGQYFKSYPPRVTGPDYAIKLREKAEQYLFLLSGFNPKQFIQGLKKDHILALKDYLNNSFSETSSHRS